MTRVLLADDHPMIQAAVEAMLRGTRYKLVSKASTGNDAYDELCKHDPDAVILDIQMPEGSGIEVLRRVREEGDERPIILLTASIDDSSFAEALALKVDGVLLKTSDPALLIDCLDSVTSGEEWIDPHLQREERASTGARDRSILSPREAELVKLVSKGLRNREIAERLGITEGTVKVYLHSVFEKTGVVNRTELAIRAGEWVG